MKNPRALIAAFILPSLILYVTFVLIPAFNAFRYSFTKWDGLSDPKYVGLKNFARIVDARADFVGAMQHNIYLMVVPGVFIIGLALYFAYQLHRDIPGARLFRIAFFFPNVISSVAISMLWILIYSVSQAGLLNNLLRFWSERVMHHPYAQIPFTQTGRLLTAMPPMLIWAATGFYMVLFLASMESIDETYYEAAKIDGASRGRTFFSVTLPLMWDVVSTGVVLLIIGGLKTFDSIWVMENSRPTKDTHTIATLMYSKVFEEYDIGYGTAIAVCLFLLVLLVTAFSFKVLKPELSPRLSGIRKVALYLVSGVLALQLGIWAIQSFGWKLAWIAVGLLAVTALVCQREKWVGIAGSAVRSVVFWAYTAAVVLPLVWVFYTSAKDTKEIFQRPFALPLAVTHPGPETSGAFVHNYRNAWTESHFSSFFGNSLYVVSISLALILALGAMTAYVLAKFRFRGGGALYYLYVIGLIIPMQLILIPLFFQFGQMGDWMTSALGWIGRPFGGEAVFSLHDSHAGLILIYVAASLPFTVFVLTAFFKSLPDELREAARMDGASEWTVFLRVMMPLAKPGLITVAIFNFLGLWNEYLFALVFINSEKLKTLPLGLASINIQSQYKSDYGLLFAGLVIVMIPTLLVYIALQDRLTKGITMGAVKG